MLSYRFDILTTLGGKRYPLGASNRGRSIFVSAADVTHQLGLVLDRQSLYNSVKNFQDDGDASILPSRQEDVRMALRQYLALQDIVKRSYKRPGDSATRQEAKITLSCHLATNSAITSATGQDRGNKLRHETVTHVTTQLHLDTWLRSQPLH